MSSRNSEQRAKSEGPSIADYWVAVKELKLLQYPPTLENQMEKNMEHEMETGGI